MAIEKAGKVYGMAAFSSEATIPFGMDNGPRFALLGQRLLEVKQ